MKRISLILAIFIMVFLILPKNVFAADLENKFECTVSKDTDGLVLKTCKMSVNISGSGKFNHTEGTLQLDNMEIISFTAAPGFVLNYNASTSKFSITSNHVYTTKDGSNIVYANLVAKQKNKSITNCNITLVPTKTNRETTNTFTIKKEAMKDDKVITQIKQGEAFKYRITVTSANNVLKTDKVTVTDTIPKELEIVNAYSGKVSDNTITWDLGTFETGIHSKTLYVDVRAKKDVRGLTKNIAILTVEDNKFQDDETVNIVYSDIAIVKKASRNKVTVGSEFYYTITVTNRGTGESENITVSDKLDSNLTFIKSDTTYTKSGDTYNFNIGKLKSGGIKVIRIDVKTKDKLSVARITNSAIATEEGKTPVNSTVDVDIVPRDIDPDLSIKKEVNKTNVKLGEEYQYKIIITNNNELSLIDVVITDQLDSNLTIMNAEGGVIKNNLVTWTFDLGPNATKTFNVNVKVNANTKVKKINNKATLKYENKTTPSNEVVVNVTPTLVDPSNPGSTTPGNEGSYIPIDKEPNIDNPQTGSVISYVLISIAGIISLIIYFYTKKKKKLYRL
ncbi:MAG: DUF11 domain-containing protein [Bacilli bacterium]|nr:DUF11 domain-containing protein [Bacilli bacterium]